MIQKYFEQLSTIFEKELVDEILQMEIMLINAKTILNPANCKVSFIPMVLEGSIRVYREDKKGNEIFIYDINSLQSCTLSINSTFGNNTMPAIAQTSTDSKIVLIPSEKSREWFNKYSTWRTFAMGLYGRRIDELLKQLDLSTVQKEEISDQNKKITESIRYAKRIQQAVFPSEQLLKEIGCENFILFKPRDIVSGDFYWVSQENDKIIIAAADATGHGVPGAFMSMLGIAFLNEIKDIDNESAFSSASILDKLRNKIKNSLQQTGKDDEAKDGMDIALCIIDLHSRVLQYSGAHNPLYILPSGSSNIIEIKPDRQPIGIHLKEKPFTNHEIKINKGDTFYMFSDGFVDQFGGEKNTKYKSSKFKSFISEIQSNSMEKQKQLLETEFANWKGLIEQTDDVLVIGIRIEI